MVKPQGYKTIMLKEDLLRRVDRIVNASIGYRSRADFVSEAVRLRLEEIERHMAGAYPPVVARGRGDEAGKRADQGDEPNPSTIEGKEEG